MGCVAPGEKKKKTMGRGQIRPSLIIFFANFLQYFSIYHSQPPLYPWTQTVRIYTVYKIPSYKP